METVKDVTQLSPHALETHIERCERLTERPALLARLPDKGDGIRQRHSEYVAERLRRSQLDCAAGTNDPTADNKNATGKESGSAVVCTRAVGESVSGGEATHSGTLKAKNEEAKAMAEPESFEAAARAIGEKYRHQRVPVEEIVRRTFGGSLSEEEIERMLQDVPPGFFLTHDETVKMEQKLAMEERMREFERLSVQQK